MDRILQIHVTGVQWSNGYDFCLTCVLFTEGSRFDPGLNHFLMSFSQVTRQELCTSACTNLSFDESTPRNFSGTLATGNRC
jgi:hypothetical protein